MRNFTKLKTLLLNSMQNIKLAIKISEQEKSEHDD
jgi:hypothetical protein